MEILGKLMMLELLTFVVVEHSKCVCVLVTKELAHYNIRVLLYQPMISNNENRIRATFNVKVNVKLPLL